jgi:ubiquinone/menaquinone biosynthesis C-methylase UbiE
VNEKEKDDTKQDQKDEGKGFLAELKEKHMLKVQLSLALLAFLVSVVPRLLEGHDRYSFLDSYKDPIAWHRQFAKEYNSIYEQWGYKLHVNVTDRLHDILGQHKIDVSAARLLDVGAASGLVGSALQRRGYRHIVGIDVVPEILAEANSTGAYASVITGDAESLPIKALDDASFDAVLCVGTIGYLGRGEQDELGPALDHSRTHTGPLAEAARVDKLLKEWLRVLKPGGIMALTVEVSLKKSWEAAFVDLQSARLLNPVEVSQPVDFVPLNPHKYTAEQKVLMYFHRKPE